MFGEINWDAIILKNSSYLLASLYCCSKSAMYMLGSLLLMRLLFVSFVISEIFATLFTISL